MASKKKNVPDQPIIIQGNTETPYYRAGEFAYVVHPVHGWKLRKVCINSWSEGCFKLSSGEHYIGFCYSVSAEESLDDIVNIPEIYLRKDPELGSWYDIGSATNWGGAKT
jgi:hypothetical protein